MTRRRRQPSYSKVGGAHYFTYKRTRVCVGLTGGVAWVLDRSGAGGGGGEKSAAARAFVERHLDYARTGHASRMMGFTWAALGAAGKQELRAAFWKQHLGHMLAQRRRVGSFTVPMHWKDLGFDDRNDKKPPTAMKKTMRDHWYGDSWATGWFLLAWQIGRGKSVLLRKPVPKSAAGTD